MSAPAPSADSEDNFASELFRQGAIVPGQFPGDLINGSNHVLQELRDLAPMFEAWIDSIRNAPQVEQAERKEEFDHVVRLLKYRVAVAQSERKSWVASLIQSTPNREIVLSGVLPFLDDLFGTFGTRSRLAAFEEQLFQFDGRVMNRLLSEWAIMSKRTRANDVYGLRWALWCGDGVLPVGRRAIRDRTSELEKKGGVFTSETKRRLEECAVFDGDEMAALVLVVEHEGTRCQAFFLADVHEDEGARIISARNDVCFVTSGKLPKPVKAETPPTTLFQRHAEEWWATFSGRPLKSLGRRPLPGNTDWDKLELEAAVKQFVQDCGPKRPRLNQFVRANAITEPELRRYLKTYDLPTWKQLVRNLQESEK